MNHEALRERLSAYLEEELEESERVRVEEHLESCPDCRREYRELRHVVDLLRRLPSPDPPPELADRVIARLRAGEGRPGLVARCRARASRIADISWSTPLAAVAVGMVALAIVRGVDVSLEFPGANDSEVVPATPVAAESPAEHTARGIAAFHIGPEPDPAEVVSPMLACLRAGGPSRSRVGPGDPCAHWDSWMVGLGMRDAPAFVIEFEAVPARDREWVLGRIGDFATRSGSAPLLAGTLRSAGDPRAKKLANRIERAGFVTTR